VSEPERIVVADPDAAALEAAARIGEILAGAVERRGVAHCAATGGSAAVETYRRLASAPFREAIPWPAVEVWWGDDRYVPRDHPLSNVKPFDDIMLGIAAGEEGTGGGGFPGVPLLVDHLHPFRTGEAIGNGRGIEWCAAQTAEELRSADLETVDGWPVFDLVKLGVGGDGHLMSVFPGSPALESRELAMAIPAPTHIEPHVPRVTLNPAIVAVARHVLVVVYGADKATIMADVLGPVVDPRRWPAQLARREGATWILDEAAASKLRD
jgi:6-phosphogluconolactonase